MIKQFKLIFYNRFDSVFSLIKLLGSLGATLMQMSWLRFPFSPNKKKVSRPARPRNNREQPSTFGESYRFANVQAPMV